MCEYNFIISYCVILSFSLRAEASGVQRICSKSQRRKSSRSEQSTRHTRSRLPDLPRGAGNEFPLQRRAVRTWHVRKRGNRMPGIVGGGGFMMYHPTFTHCTHAKTLGIIYCKQNKNNVDERSGEKRSQAFCVDNRMSR